MNLCQKILINTLVLGALFGTFFLFTAFIYSCNVQHQFRDNAMIEKQLFDGAQNIQDSPSFYNSDLLMPYLIVQDALKDPRALEQWTYSPALYIFPDWFIAALFILLKIPNKLLPIFYSAFLFTALSSIIGALIVRLSNTSFWIAVSVASISLLIDGLFTLAFPKDILSYYLFAWTGSPYIHSGALLMTLIGCYCLLRSWAKAPNSIMNLIMLALIVFLSSVSDFIFVVWFVAPASLLCLLLYRFNRDKFSWKLLFTIVVPAIGALLMESLISGKPLQARAHHTGSVSLWITDLYHLFMTGDYVMLMIVGVNALLLMRTAYLLYRACKGRPLSNLMMLEILLGFICLFGLTAPLALNLYRGLPLWRYFLILTILPPLWLTLLLSMRLKALSNKKIMGGCILGILVLLNAMMDSKALQSLSHLQSLTPLEACLIKEGLKTGYSDYWNAKSLIFSTERQIHTIQLLGSTPYHFAFNKDWFKKRADSQGDFEPNFVILENLNASEIRQAFGNPDSIIKCQDKVIWRFEHILPLPAELETISSL